MHINPSDREAADAIRRSAVPLTIGDPAAYDPLVESCRDARVVLLGEASHGTHEFYRARAVITRRLIEEHGFTAVAVEGDWPDVYRVNRFVRGLGDDSSALQALSDFTRFPTWMWRNREVWQFVKWLETFNRNLDLPRQAGFYGLDLYSLYRSARAVVDYLEGVDPEAARRARQRYACLDTGSDEEAQSYGLGVHIGAREDCTDEVVTQLMELREAGGRYQLADGLLMADEQFQAEQNARVVRNAEEYYRAMFGAGENTWNLRDGHMANTLDALVKHLSVIAGEEARVVVWAHNSHVGDARATARSHYGELNLGQLARQRWGDDARLVGFTTHSGTVTAASDWDAPLEVKAVRPSMEGSYERLLHSAGADIEDGRFMIRTGAPGLAEGLAQRRLERAIGVIYRPETERQSHYFHCVLPEQFDYVLHFDTTQALEPLDPTAAWEEAGIPETYPFGV